ncbi:MAG: helix-turn-helix transcriptional regulator [Rhodospirillaceae bacterium]
MTTAFIVGNVPMMETLDWKRRIRDALAARGLSMKAASKAAGKGETFVRDILERDRTPGIEAFAALAKGLGVSVSALLSGDGPKAEVSIVGYVGAGAEAHYYATAHDPGEKVPAPDGATPATVAVEVRGESLGPMFDRWLVFFDDRREPVTPDLIGRLCVVGLADDRVLIKQIKASRTHGLVVGQFRLLAHYPRPLSFAVQHRSAYPRRAGSVGGQGEDDGAAIGREKKAKACAGGQEHASD